ncbi:MAG: hypothetical protein ACK5WO_03335 [Cyclobacteriaceae bacterium]|jgi:hypothetical protein
MRALIVCMILAPVLAYPQKNFDGFRQIYPVTDDPYIGLRTSYVPSETILFEASPTVRYSFSNNIMDGLMEDKPHMRAWYISFRPHLRMYTDNSLPVKTPSYRIFFGTQHMFRFTNDRFLTVALESGHYSNGQAGCAFNENIADGTPACDSVYRLINDHSDLSHMLNRSSGNFSTNLTELIFNYRINQLDDDMRPRRVHSIRAGFVLYHDNFLGVLPFGGYSEADIDLYGRIRYQLGYEYIHSFDSGTRLSVAENLELIQGAHPRVNPWRSDLRITYYAWKNIPEFGVFLSYLAGHDNYNFRFVDSGHQLMGGITWSIFPPVALKSGNP